MKLLINFSIVFIFYYINIQECRGLALFTSKNETNSTLSSIHVSPELLNPKQKNMLFLESDSIKLEKSPSNENNSGKSLSKFPIILGCIFCVFSLILTILNEFYSLRQFKMFDRALKDCKEIGSEEFEKENMNKLVLVSGLISAPNKIVDEDTGISVEKSLKLIRVVEMNQWKEVCVEDKIVYQQIWSQAKINSDTFKNDSYKNPRSEEWLLENKVVYVDDPKLGVFHIFPYHIDIIPNLEGVYIDNSFTNVIEDNLKEILQKDPMNDNVFMQIKNNFIYIKSNPNKADSIGDIRIKYQRVPSKEYTAIAGVYENTLVPYNTNGFLLTEFDEESIKKINKNTHIFWIRQGKEIKQEIFHIYDDRNQNLEWFLRIFTYLLCLIGIFLILTVFSDSFDSLRILSSLGSLANIFFALTLTHISWILLVSLFWLGRKPIYGTFLLFVFLVFLVILVIILTKGGSVSAAKGKFLF